MSFRKPCHMPFLKLIQPFTLTEITPRYKSKFACFLFKQNRYARNFSSYAWPLKVLHCGAPVIYGFWI